MEGKGNYPISLLSGFLKDLVLTVAIFCFKGCYWGTHHLLRKHGQYYLFSPGNNSRDLSNWCGLRTPFLGLAGWLVLEKGWGFLGEQESPAVVSRHLYIVRILISSCFRLCESMSQHNFVPSTLESWADSWAGLEFPSREGEAACWPMMQRVSLWPNLANGFGLVSDFVWAVFSNCSVTIHKS